VVAHPGVIPANARFQLDLGDLTTALGTPVGPDRRRFCHPQSAAFLSPTKSCNAALDGASVRQHPPSKDRARSLLLGTHENSGPRVRVPIAMAPGRVGRVPPWRIECMDG